MEREAWGGPRLEFEEDYTSPRDSGAGRASSTKQFGEAARGTQRRAREMSERARRKIEAGAERAGERARELAQVHLRANGTAIVEPDQESKASVAYRKTMNAQGSPSEIVAAGYSWAPGTELTKTNARKPAEEGVRA